MCCTIATSVSLHLCQLLNCSSSTTFGNISLPLPLLTLWKHKTNPRVIFRPKVSTAKYTLTISFLRLLFFNYHGVHFPIIIFQCLNNISTYRCKYHNFQQYVAFLNPFAWVFCMPHNKIRKIVLSIPWQMISQHLWYYSFRLNISGGTNYSIFMLNSLYKPIWNPSTASTRPATFNVCINFSWLLNCYKSISLFPFQHV